MKKLTILFAMVAIAFTTTVNAEDFGRGYGRRGYGSSSDNPFTIGAGYNMLHYYVSGNGTSISTDYHGFYLGGAYSINLSGDLAIEPGLTLFMNFHSESDNSYGVATESSTTLIDLAIPVNFTYGIDLGGAKLTFLAGPVINFGVVASHKNTRAGVTTTTNNYEGDGAPSRFDLMVDAGARVTFGQFGINLSYALGLLNRYSDLPDGVSAKQNRLTAGVSYSF